MERAVPSTLTGSIASAYVSELETIVNYITNTKGAYAIICAQNFGRYYGNIIEDTTGFEAFWKTIATQFQSNSKVVSIPAHLDRLSMTNAGRSSIQTMNTMTWINSLSTISTMRP